MDETEKIDSDCMGIYGHTNWAYWDTLSESQQRVFIKEEHGDLIEGIAYFYEEADENNEHDSLEEHEI